MEENFDSLYHQKRQEGIDNCFFFHLPRKNTAARKGYFCSHNDKWQDETEPVNQVP